MLLSCPELPAQEPSARSSYFFRDAVGGGHPTTALLTEIAEERSRFHRHRPRADLHPLALPAPVAASRRIRRLLPRKP